jgi:SAM-dependent methyltransferase
MGKLAGVLAGIGKSVRQRGIRGTIGRCLAEPLYRLRDRRFDRRFDVRTSGIVAIPDLDIGETDRIHAERYQPVRIHAFAELMKILTIRHEEFIFVDFGSGKGRAMLLAAEFPFRRIIGIELSPTLCEIAATNLRTYRNPAQRCTKLDIVCQNASAWAIPPEAAVLYFYNPFGKDVMLSILENLRRSLAGHPRRVFVVLYNPVLEHIVEQVDFLRMYKTTGRCSIYLNTPYI